MSNEEKRFLKKWLLAAGGVLMTQTLAVSSVFIADHYSLAQLKDDVAVIRPRVEELWWRSRGFEKKDL